MRFLSTKKNARCKRAQRHLLGMDHSMVGCKAAYRLRLSKIGHLPCVQVCFSIGHFQTWNGLHLDPSFMRHTSVVVQLLPDRLQMDSGAFKFCRPSPFIPTSSLPMSGSLQENNLCQLSPSERLIYNPKQMSKAAYPTCLLPISTVMSLIAFLRECSSSCFYNLKLEAN